MKLNIKALKLVAISIILIAGLSNINAQAQKYAVKVYGDIGMGNAMSLTSGLPGMTSKSSSNSFGVDFGYTFWKKGKNTLEANIGLGYRMASVKFDVAGLEYSYDAPASADEDGNPYRRYTSITNLNQKMTLGFLNIPLYLQYQFRLNKWVGVYADFGFGLGFRCVGSVGSTTGQATSYGVYAQYDNLVIDADYLNGFGKTNLADAVKGDAEIKGFDASVLAGVGFEFFIAKPVSINLGARYNVGMTDIFTGVYKNVSSNGFSAESAPITYTVSEGQKVNALSDYLSKSKLNPLSLHIGVNVRF